jgi:hypothetical protein
MTSLPTPVPGHPGNTGHATAANRFPASGSASGGSASRPAAAGSGDGGVGVGVGGLATTPRWGVTLPLAGIPLREHRLITTGLADAGYSFPGTPGPRTLPNPGAESGA